MKVLKRIGIVGAGNVGSALVMELASTPTIAKQIVVASRNLNHAEATLLDAGSAFPETAKNFEAAKTLDGFFDVVVVTAGLMPHSDITLDELLEQNVQIVHDMLTSASCKYLIVIGTPVDRLTERISEDGSVHAEHIWRSAGCRSY